MGVMSEFIVEADGYSIEFLESNGLKYQNSDLKIALEPTGNHRAMIKRAKRENKHYKTCIATVKVNDVNDCKTAIKKTEEILDELSYYLAFVFNHEVFFQNLKSDSVGCNTKNSDTRLRNMPVGRMNKRSHINPADIQEFINRGFNKFLNEDFNKGTGIRRAILWYNAGRDNDYPSAEIIIASHFIALEILASCFANENPLQPRLPKNTYSKFKNELEKLYPKLDIVKWDDIHSAICGEIQRITVKQKIDAFLSDYDLHQYAHIAHDFVDLRNKIFHEGQGGAIKDYGGWAEVLKKIDRLLVKLILKILGCYDMDAVYSEIKNDDLMATRAKVPTVKVLNHTFSGDVHHT